MVIKEFKFVLHCCFRMKDLGELRHYLGIDLARSSKGIHICQRKYVLELLSKVGLSAAKPTKTPMEVNRKLTSSEYDKQFKINQLDNLLNDVTSYKWLIRKLFYLTFTCPDISYAVQHLSQFL